MLQQSATRPTHKAMHNLVSDGPHTLSSLALFSSTNFLKVLKSRAPAQQHNSIMLSSASASVTQQQVTRLQVKHAAHAPLYAVGCPLCMSFTVGYPAI